MASALRDFLNFHPKSNPLKGFALSSNAEPTNFDFYYSYHECHLLWFWFEHYRRRHWRIVAKRLPQQTELNASLHSILPKAFVSERFSYWQYSLQRDNVWSNQQCHLIQVSYPSQISLSLCSYTCIYVCISVSWSSLCLFSPGTPENPERFPFVGAF